MAKVTIELTDTEFKELLQQLTYIEESVKDVQEKIQELINRGNKENN
jgi:hypothetical protein